jgi:hypothetical protein
MLLRQPVLGSGRALGWTEAAGRRQGCDTPVLRANRRCCSGPTSRDDLRADPSEASAGCEIYPPLAARIISHPRPLLERQGSPLDRHSRRSHTRSLPNTARRSPRAVSILIWNAAFAIIVGVRLCLYSSGKRTSPIVGKARSPGSSAATPSPSMSSACPPISRQTFLLWP